MTTMKMITMSMTMMRRTKTRKMANTAVHVVGDQVSVGGRGKGSKAEAARALPVWIPDAVEK